MSALAAFANWLSLPASLYHNSCWNLQVHPSSCCHLRAEHHTIREEAALSSAKDQCHTPMADCVHINDP